MTTSLVMPVMLAAWFAGTTPVVEETAAATPLAYRFDATSTRETRLALTDRRDQAATRPAADAFAPAMLADEPVTPHFGSAGSVRLNVHGGFGADVKTTDNRLALLGVGWSFFIFDNLSLELELNGMHFHQVGRDAMGGNVNLLFRWHFLARETWSMYADAGAGALFTNRKVPAHGSTFNFTPQAGFGFSFDIGHDLRLMTGVRWHHVSNASIYRSNPGRDHVMGYVGVSMPF